MSHIHDDSKLTEALHKVGVTTDNTTPGERVRMAAALEAGKLGITTDSPQPTEFSRRVYQQWGGEPPANLIALFLTELEAVDLVHGIRFLIDTCDWPVDRLAHVQEILQNNVPVQAMQDRISGPIEILPKEAYEIIAMAKLQSPDWVRTVIRIENAKPTPRQSLIARLEAHLQEREANAQASGL
jgi:hypothetical protein